MEEPYPPPTCHNLSLSPTTNSTTTAAATSNTNTTSTSSAQTTSLDYDVVVILAAMICALVCALGLNSMLQCVVRCTRRTVTGPADWAAARRLNAGLRREHVLALPVATFSSSSTATATATATAAAASPPIGCPICLTDFSDGDKIRVLPACRHRFHVGCIDTWLLSHCSCPTCRNRLPPPATAANINGGEEPVEIVTTT